MLSDSKSSRYCTPTDSYRSVTAWEQALELWRLSTLDLVCSRPCTQELVPGLTREWLAGLPDVQTLCKVLKPLLTQWRNMTTVPISEVYAWLLWYKTNSSWAYYVLEPISQVVLEFGYYRDYQSFMIVHHFLSFLAKYPTGAPELAQIALTEYKQQEETLKTEFDQNLIDELRAVLLDWCQGIPSIDLWNLGFGPGSTADAGSSAQSKLSKLSQDELLRATLPDYSWCFVGPDSDIRTSKTIFVPKNALSLRTISMESSSLSFWQRPVENLLKWIISNRLYRHADLSHQSKSRELALAASYSQDYATLDLSAASDSLSLSLVEKVFPAPIMKLLVGVRATHSKLPDGSIIKLKKYAPMGSRTTFPMLTIIACAICEVAVRRTVTIDTTASRTPYWVYGDDIIIKNEYVSSAVNLLEEYGFRVNQQKSFVDGCFREACGVFAYNGYDITTPCIPRDFKGLPTKGKAFSQSQKIVGAIDLCNRLLMSGMSRARRYVMSHLPIEFLPFASFEAEFLADDNSDDAAYGGKINYHQRGIWTFGPADNHHLKSRKIPDYVPCPPILADHKCDVLALPGPYPKKHIRTKYQEYESLIITPHIESYGIPYDDECRYQLWLMHHVLESGTSENIVTEIPRGTRPRIRLRKQYTQL